MLRSLSITPWIDGSSVAKEMISHLSDFLMLPVTQKSRFEPSARVSVNQFSCVRSSVPSRGVMKQLSSRFAVTRISVIEVVFVEFSG